jgi:hypothetical protein
MNQISTDLQTISGDASTGSPQAVISDCEALITDASAVGVGPHIPVAALEVTWATAIGDLLAGSHDWIVGLQDGKSSEISKGSSLISQARGEITTLGEQITGGSSSGATAASPPPEATTPITSPTTTTLACPSGSPRLTTTISASPDPLTPGFWDITDTDTVTNTLNAPVTVEAADIQLVDSSGNALDPVALTPSSDEPVTLNPGQSAPFTDGGNLSIPASSQPRFSSATVTWNWPVGSPYFTCPDGV